MAQVLCQLSAQCCRPSIHSTSVIPLILSGLGQITRENFGPGHQQEICSDSNILGNSCNRLGVVPRHAPPWGCDPGPYFCGTGKHCRTRCSHHRQCLHGRPNHHRNPGGYSAWRNSRQCLCCGSSLPREQGFGQQRRLLGNTSQYCAHSAERRSLILNAGHGRGDVLLMEELHRDGDGHLSTFPVQGVPVDRPAQLTLDKCPHNLSP